MTERANLRVVVAHGEQTIRESAAVVARRLGYAVISVSDGESALLLLRSQPVPAAVVADVALSGVLGYELCDEIARASLPTKVIFIASVYSKTAYKRRPTSLYGASDYVEQHHIVDQLGEKLDRAITGGERSPFIRRRQLSDTGEHKLAEIRAAGEGRLTFRYRSNKEGEDRARNLARLLVADMLLYVGDTVEAWRGRGAPGDYPPELEQDVEEARRLYELRVPGEIAARRDYFGEELRAVMHFGDEGGSP